MTGWELARDEWVRAGCEWVAVAQTDAGGGIRVYV
jgi:hypothetical protein